VEELMASRIIEEGVGRGDVEICPLCYPTQFALNAHLKSSGF
jgi:hypothetical protein